MTPPAGSWWFSEWFWHRSLPLTLVERCKSLSDVPEAGPGVLNDGRLVSLLSLGWSDMKASACPSRPWNCPWFPPGRGSHTHTQLWAFSSAMLWGWGWPRPVLSTPQSTNPHRRLMLLMRLTSQQWRFRLPSGTQRPGQRPRGSDNSARRWKETLNIVSVFNTNSLAWICACIQFQVLLNSELFPFGKCLLSG